MEYLRLFENHSGYTEFKNSINFIKPNVSHCIEQNEMHYSPKIPYITININAEATENFTIATTHNISEYVDIALDDVSIIDDLFTNGNALGFEITNGEHALKYYFSDINHMPSIQSFFYNLDYRSKQLYGTMIIPNGVKRIDKFIQAKCELIVPDSLEYVATDIMCDVILSEATMDKLDSCCEEPEGYLTACGK